MVGSSKGNISKLKILQINSTFFFCFWSDFCHSKSIIKVMFHRKKMSSVSAGPSPGGSIHFSLPLSPTAEISSGNATLSNLGEMAAVHYLSHGSINPFSFFIYPQRKKIFKKSKRWSKYLYILKKKKKLLFFYIKFPFHWLLNDKNWQNFLSDFSIF